MDNDSGCWKKGSAERRQDMVSLVLDVLRSQIALLCGQDGESQMRNSLSKMP